MTHLNDELKQRFEALQLRGLIEHWSQVPPAVASWLPTLADWEESERSQRGLQRRLRLARLGRFKSLDEFDWDWPTHCDRTAINTLMTLDFIEQTGNVVLVGPNGVGKSTIAKNLAWQALMQGHNALFTTAASMLSDLASKDGDYALRRRLSYYASPTVLVIDEIGYLSYGTRHADLLFEIINRRYELKSTIVTTNKPFAEWGEVFPNAACVVSLVDRLIHHADIQAIEGESYRMREARERAEQSNKTASAQKAGTNKKSSTNKPKKPSGPTS